MLGVTGVPVRLLVLTSRTVWEPDEAGGWVQRHSDEPVADQFNNLADKENFNPVSTPSVTKTIHDEPTRRTAYTTLCAVVINRDVQAAEELAMRVRVAKAMQQTNPAAPSPVTGERPFAT